MSNYTLRDKVIMTLFIVAMAMFLYIVWFFKIYIEIQFIPSIINGLTSAVSLILALSSASIVLISRSANKSKSQSSPFPFRFLFILMAPALTLLFAYVRLMAADYYLALQVAMTSFIVSFAILFIYMEMLISREDTKQ